MEKKKEKTFPGTKRGGIRLLLHGPSGRMTYLTALCGVLGLSGAILSWFSLTAPWVPIFLYALAYVTGGFYATRSALSALWSLTVDVNLLMVVAALGAASIGHWGEGTVLMFLFSLSNTLEAMAMGSTRRAIRSLVDLRPAEALVLQDGREVRVAADTLSAGDHIMVRPGEMIPADGLIVSGDSSVDQSSITGEALPMEKGPGASVFAGTLNQQGALEVRVTRCAEDTTLARIVRLVEKAQAQKAQAQRLTEWFGRYYSVGVIGGAAALAFIPPLFFEVSFSQMFYRAMILLVVSSPCAAVISIPASILSAIARAASDGILFKGGTYLEDLAGVQVMAFDKTGTLTTGRPRVTDILPTNGAPSEELLRIAASAERFSGHPLAEAVVEAASSKGLTLIPTSSLQSIGGRGVRAELEGKTVLVGNERLYEEEGISLSPRVHQIVATLEEEGKTTMIVREGDASDSDGALGVIGLADTLRPGVHRALEGLKRNGIHRTVMLTGDNERAARSVAATLGIEEVRADLLPEEKVEVVQDLIRTHGKVAMVGDGVNDAPALAVSTVGLVMGAAGSDVALETADIVLMGDDLRKIPHALSLSRHSLRILKQNLLFSFLVMASLVVLTLTGGLSLPLGVVGHEGSTLLVVANGLRLLRKRKRI